MLVRSRTPAETGATAVAVVLVAMMLMATVTVAAVDFATTSKVSQAQFDSGEATLDRGDDASTQVMKGLVSGGGRLTDCLTGSRTLLYRVLKQRDDRQVSDDSYVRVDCQPAGVLGTPGATVDDSIVLFSTADEAFVRTGWSDAFVGAGLRMNRSICYKVRSTDPVCMPVGDEPVGIPHMFESVEGIGDLVFTAHGPGANPVVQSPECPRMTYDTGTHEMKPPTPRPTPAQRTPLNLRSRGWTTGGPSPGPAADLPIGEPTGYRGWNNAGNVQSLWKCNSGNARNNFGITPLTYSTSDPLYGTGQYPYPPGLPYSGAPPAALTGVLPVVDPTVPVDQPRLDSCETRHSKRLNDWDYVFPVPGDIQSCIRYWKPGDYSLWTDANLDQQLRSSVGWHKICVTLPWWLLGGQYCDVNVPTTAIRANVFEPGLYYFDTNLNLRIAAYSVKTPEYLINTWLLPPFVEAFRGICGDSCADWFRAFFLGIWEMIKRDWPEFSQKFHAPILAGVPRDPHDPVNRASPSGCVAEASASFPDDRGVQFMFAPGAGLHQGVGIPLDMTDPNAWNPPAEIFLCPLNAAQESAINTAYGSPIVKKGIALYQIPGATVPPRDTQYDALNSAGNQVDSSHLAIAGLIYAPRGRVRVATSLLNRNEMPLGYGLIADELEMNTWQEGYLFKYGVPGGGSRIRVWTRECKIGDQICPNSGTGGREGWWPDYGGLVDGSGVPTGTTPLPDGSVSGGDFRMKAPEGAGEVLIDNSGGAPTARFDKWWGRAGFEGSE